jgi:hypothetical protein
MRLTSLKKWAFGIRSWRFVTFPTAVGVGIILARTSPFGLFRAVGWAMAGGYAFAFALVAMGYLRLPER